MAAFLGCAPLSKTGAPPGKVEPPTNRSALPLAEADEPGAPPKQVLFKLNREGFIQELVFAQATPRTGEFDDYTPGSYHVDPLDLADGVRTRQSTQTPAIRALLVIGPYGALWAFDVWLFEEEGEVFRANRLVFAHARITFKATKLLSRQDLDSLLGTLERSRALVSGAPTANANYGLLLADWRTGSDRLFYWPGDFYKADIPPEVAQLVEALAAALHETTVTYASDLPATAKESVYRDLELLPH